MDSHVLNKLPQKWSALLQSRGSKKAAPLLGARCIYRDYRRLTNVTAGLPALLTDGFDNEQIYNMAGLVYEAETDLTSEDDVARLLEEVERKRVEAVQDSGFEMSSQQDSEDADENDEQNDDSDVALSSDEEHEKLIRRIVAKIEGDENDLDDLADMGVDNENEDEEEMAEDEEEMAEDMDIEDEDESGEDEDKNKKEIKTTKTKHRKSEVDDDFFKLDDMEKFLDEEDRKAATLDKGEEEEGDDDLLDDEDLDGKNDQPIMYEDFFDPPTADENATGTKRKDKGDRRELRKGRQGESGEEEEDSSEAEETPAKKMQLFDDDDDDDEQEENKEGMSFNEKRKKNIKTVVKQQEEMNLQEKSWQMSGEALARLRPENSLLEVTLNHTTAAPTDPEITEKTTEDLESWIRQRIKDKAWDDVERKVKPKEDSFEYRKKVTLESRKSEKSLMAEYEDMYRQQTQPEAQQVEVKDPKKEAIKKSMRELFLQLDALSHFNYTPRKPASEIRIVNNTPALSQEEVAPIGMSDATLVAPEEVQAPMKRDEKAKTERTTSDRKRERRLKKVHQRKKFQEEEKREKTMRPSKSKNKKEREKLLKGLSKKFRGVTVLKS